MGRCEPQTSWGIKKFVRDTCINRIVKIKADNQTCAAADPQCRALFMIRADVRTHMSQVWSNPTISPSDTCCQKTATGM